MLTSRYPCSVQHLKIAAEVRVRPTPTTFLIAHYVIFQDDDSPNSFGRRPVVLGSTGGSGSGVAC